jgi:hypothetical protein
MFIPTRNNPPHFAQQVFTLTFVSHHFPADVPDWRLCFCAARCAAFLFRLRSRCLKLISDVSLVLVGVAAQRVVPLLYGW